MEVRMIKTCYGLKRIRLENGALLPPDVQIVELCEARLRKAQDPYAWLTPEVMARVFANPLIDEVASVEQELSDKSKTSPTVQAETPVSERVKSLTAALLRWVNSFPTFPRRQRS